MLKALNAATCKEERKGDLTHIEESPREDTERNLEMLFLKTTVMWPQARIQQTTRSWKRQRQTPCPSHTLPEPPEGKWAC